MLNPPKQVPDQITETLRQAKSILIACHVFPDVDAIGSQLALGNILESLGKNIFYYCEEFISGMYQFLPGSEKNSTIIFQIYRNLMLLSQLFAETVFGLVMKWIRFCRYTHLSLLIIMQDTGNSEI